MTIDVEIDVYDAVVILRRELSKVYGHEVDGIYVRSWNTPVLKVRGDLMEKPVRHRLRPEHAELKE